MTSLLHHYPTDTVPMRPISDKEVEVIDLDHLFEEYVETEHLHHYSDSTADQSSSDDLAHIFELSSSNESELFGTDPILDRDSEAAWHKALDKYEQQQNPTSSLPCDDFASSFYVSSASGKESHSDSELLSFEDLFELERNQLRSISQPSTPRPHTSTGRSVKKATSFHNRLKHRGISKSSTKKSPATSFAKMMQPSYYRSPIPDVWTRKMDTPADSFLRASSHGITSPPPSSKPVQHENGNGFFAQEHHQTYTSPHDEPDFSNYQLTPSASPSIGISNNNNNNNGGFNDNVGLAFSSSVSSAALSALQTPPSSLRLPMTTWGPDSSPALDFSFSASPDFANGTKTAGWWDEDVSTAAHPDYRDANARSTSQNLGLKGLGISCDSASLDFGAETASFDMSSYGNVYPTPPRQHSQQHNMVPIGHPLSRSPSPSPHPRFHRRRPSNHSSHHRSSISVSQHWKSSNSSSQSSRQLLTGSLGSVGFVNFTPEDSRKILTGVAPSGSSKTKARREKEAADKRRKLSQATVKAVMEAGGDMDSIRRLEREGLLVMEG
jgi:hypothetical protein